MTTTTWDGPPRSPDEFAHRLDVVGLRDHVDQLVALCRPSLRLVPTPPDSAESSRTKLGGRPRLPPDTAWPKTDAGLPLSFVAQIDCAEVAPLPADPALPRDGLLSFFYEGVEQDAWGFDPAQSDCWSVVHTPAHVDTTTRDFPDALTEHGRFRESRLRPVLEWTVPSWSSVDVDQLGLPCPRKTYARASGEDQSDPSIHRLLGHPDHVQGDMQYECQLAGNGIYCGNGEQSRTPEARALLPGSTDWRLLLQIDSAEDLGMMWGDDGRLYWWMRDADLREGSWHRAWFVLQCY